LKKKSWRPPLAVQLGKGILISTLRGRVFSY
jgi:hypothetical protein